MSYQQHPLSAAFPAMSPEDFQALTDSVEAIGIQNPITLYEGMVIDGWHRYSAANAVGIECPVVELDPGIDPRDFVLAQNKARRHITQAQIAMATATVFEWQPAGRPESGKGGTECRVSKTNAEMARIAGVSERTMREAKAVLASAPAEVKASVLDGSIGLKKATAAITPQPAKKTAVEAANDASDETAEHLDYLQAEIERLNGRLAVEAMDASEEEKTAAAEMIEELRAQVRSLEHELNAVKSQRDAYMVENQELKKQCASYQRALKKVAA